MHTKPRTFRWTLIATGLCLLTVAFLIPQTVGADLPATPSHIVQQAWDKAREVGVYHVRTELVQTTYPAPSLANVGRTTEQDRLFLEGQIDRPADAMSLTLWQGGGSVMQPHDALEIRIEGDQAQGRTGNGPWQQIDDFSGAFAPGQDLMGYLAAADHVQELETDIAAPLTGTYSRYTFEIDGPAFALYLRDQLEVELQRSGDLPVGVNLDLTDEARATTGSGEVWIDERGLPLRLSVHMVYPPQADGRRIEADVTTDFSRFPEEALARIEQPRGRLSGVLPQTPRAWRDLGRQSLMVLGTSSLALALVFVRRTRQLYAAIAITMVTIMIVSPLLQSQQVYAFNERVRLERAEQEAQEQIKEEARAWAVAQANPTWDGNRDPLVHKDTSDRDLNTLFVARSPIYALPSAASGAEGARPASSYSLQSAGVDTDPEGDVDGDGLTNIQEARLGTSFDQDDSDGDGITDQVEVQGFEGGDGKKWYLNPNDPDTDGDGLPDGLECSPLLRPSNTQLSPTAACPDLDGDAIPNPFDRDSDGDGAPDNVDLSPFSARRSAATPFDADHPFAFNVSGLSDGTPKPLLVDFQLRPQNPDHLAYALSVLDWPSGDTEGQVQRVLNTTFADTMTAEERVHQPQAANGDLRLIPMLEIDMDAATAPLAWTTPAMEVTWQGEISGVAQLTQAGSDVQLDLSDWSRTTRTYFEIYEGPCDALGASWFGPFSVPRTGDSYTLQDRALTDFADGLHAIVAYHTTGDQARTCTTVGNVINGAWDDRMVDPEPLEIAGLTVQEKDNATLTAYVPLALVEDELGSQRVAFAGHMLYQPGSAGWGKNHRVRLVWLVQMLTDRCDAARLDFLAPMAALDQTLYDETYRDYCSQPDYRIEETQIVHLYDDAWYLTGMAVREDHGVDVAILYEEPGADDDTTNDDRLWTLASGLEAAFVSGRDADGDGARDLTIETLEQRFGAGAIATLTESWGIPSAALGLETYDATTFPHQDYLMQIPMQYAPEILEAHFTRADGSAKAAAPSLLIAREERARTLNLDDLGGVNDDRRQALSFTDAGIARNAVETVALVQWSPYRLGVDGWEAYPIDEYMTLLGARLTPVFKADPEFYNPENPDASDALDVEIKLAQGAYLSYYGGIAAMVQRGNTPTPQTGFLRTDREHFQWVKKGWTGATNKVTRMIYTKVASKGLTALLDAMADRWLSLVRFAQGFRVSEKQFLYVVSTYHVPGYEHLWDTVDTKATTLSKWGRLKQLMGNARESLVQKLREVWSKIKAHKGLAIAGAVVGAAFLITSVVLTGLGKWEIALQVIAVGVSLSVLTLAVYQVYKVGIQAAMRATEAISKGTIIGMVIGAVVAFGFMLYAWISSGIHILSQAFRSLLAQTVAQVYVLALLFVLAMNPIGAVVAAIIGLIDALITAVCTAIGDEAWEHAAGQWLCKGLSGLATELLKNWIYDAHELVDMDHPDRLQIFGFDQGVTVPRWGLREGNSLRVSLSLTNTIRLAHVFPEGETMLEGWKDGTRLIPIDWKSLAYFYQFSNSNLKSATFDYTLQTSETDIHEDLERKTMKEAWMTDEADPGALEIVPFFVVETASISGVPLAESGINRTVSLYLSEGYALPVQECFAIPNHMLPPGIPLYSLMPVCYLSTNSGTTHIDLGESIQLDVFPASLDGFYELATKNGGYSLAWGQRLTLGQGGDLTFARQRDADGDGLINRRDGGADPDDSAWDTDGDGLSDFYEYEVGTPLTQIDADGDGLDDAREARLGTNAYRADTDGDGLTDLEEVNGWEIIYDITSDGEQLRTWVTSNPLTADNDLDGISDFLEKAYGFHPEVPSAGNVLTLDSTIQETTAPRLLYRFEDAAGTTAFVDDSGYDQTASCTGETCPTVVAGRYGTALHFDGDDDWVETADIDTGNDFTVAFWMKPEAADSGRPIIIGKHGPGGVDRVLVGFWADSYYVKIRDEAHKAGTKTAGWQHIAVVAHQTGAHQTEVTVYRDGDRLWQQTLNAVAGDMSGLPWVLGQDWAGTRLNDFYRGFLDEVAVFDYALTRAEIRRTMQARYNPNDRIVLPDAAFDYEAVVTNELMGRQAQGLLTTDFPSAFAGNTIDPQPFILHPQEKADIDGQVSVGSVVPSGPISLTQVAGALVTDWREQSGFAELWLPLNEDATVTSFQDYSGVAPPRNGTCSGARCPTRQIEGYFDYGAAFDGVNDAITLPDAETLGLTESSFTVSAWVKANDAGGGNQAFAGTDETAVNEGLYLGLNNGKLHMGFGNNGFTSDYPLTDDVWYHVVFRYTQEDGAMVMFVNGDARDGEIGHAAFQGTGTVRLGRSAHGRYFDGELDDVRIYARALTGDEVRALYGQPVLRLDFEPSGTAGQYLDTSGFGNAALGDTCPNSSARGIRGAAARFNGTQSCELLGAILPNLNFNQSAFTWSLWLRPETTNDADYDDHPQGILGNYRSYRPTDDNNQTSEDDAWARDSYPTLFRVGNTLRFGFGDGTVWRHLDTGDVLSPNSWHHVVVTFGPVYDENDNFLRNEAAIYVDNALVTRQGLGQHQPQHNPFFNSVLHLGRASTMGRLSIPTLWVKDEADGAGAAELCMSWDGQEIYAQRDMKDDYDDQDLTIEEEELGRRYDLSPRPVELFYDSGRLRFWEDDRDLTGRGNFCTGYPDDGDDPFGCDTDAQKKNKTGCDWDFNTNLPDDDFYVDWFTSEVINGNDNDAFHDAGGTKGFFAMEYENPSIPYRGKIDELTMYKRALTAEEVEELYFSTFSALRLVLDDAPGSWRFENGVSLGGQTDAYCAGGGCPTAGVRGRVGQAALFDGVDDTLTTTLTLDQSAGGPGVTYMAWVYPHSTSDGAHQVISTNDGNKDWSLLRNGNTWSAFVGGGDSFDAPAGSVAVNRWQHVAVVFKPGRGVRIYKNGIQIASDPNLHHNPQTGPVTIGGTPSGAASFDGIFDGIIDDVRVFQGALSATEIATIYRAAPILDLNFDDAQRGATRFTDETGHGLNGSCDRSLWIDRCPQAGEGIQGRIGLGLAFDGDDDHVTINDDPVLDLDTFSAGLWVKPTAVFEDQAQVLLRKGAYDDINLDLLISNGGLTPTLGFDDCDDWGFRKQVAGNVPLLLNQWNYVMGTYDGEELKLYVNGYEQGSLSVTGTPCHNDDPLFIGNAAIPPAGTLDEVMLYNRALGPYEVRDIFRYQAKWVEDRQSHRVVVDDDAPNASLVSYDSAFPYQANAYQQKQIEARDGTSGVSLVELGVRKDGQSTTTWSAAPACIEGGAWCPGFDPTKLGGEGTYTLWTRAIDSVGHRATSPATTLHVDGTPPVVTADVTEGAVRAAQPASTQRQGWRVALGGTVADPVLSSLAPGSGVDTITVTLLTPDGAPAGRGPVHLQPTGADWHCDYAFTGKPTGRYTLRVSARDRVGNVRTVELATFAIDGAAPGAELDIREIPTGTLKGIETLTGWASEQTLPPGTLVRLHFEEAAGAETFYDTTHQGHEGMCEGTATCPQAGEAGPYGAALAFDGDDDHVVIADSRDFNVGRGPFALSFWFRQDVATANTLFSWKNATGRDRFLITVGVDGDLSVALSTNGISDIQVKTPTVRYQWHHLAVVRDASNAYAVYVDGALVDSGQSTANLNAIDPGSDLWLGSDRDNNGAPAYGLHGQMDEFAFFDRALTVDEVRALAQSASEGVNRVQVAFEPVLPGAPLYNEAPPEGELLHLPFDDNPDEYGAMPAFADISSHDQPGVCDGAGCPTPASEGHIEQAASFDGVDDTVTVNDIALDGSALKGGITAAAWVYPDGASQGFTTLFSTCGLVLRLFPTHIGQRYQVTAFIKKASGWEMLSSEQVLPQHTWAHLAATYDGAILRLYRDGTEIGQQAVAGAIPACTGSAEVGSGFAGRIDEARLFDRALPAPELRALYLGANPVLVLEMEDAANGDTIADASGWRHHGVLATPDALSTTHMSASGVVGLYALDMTGGDVTVNVPDSTALDLTTFSIGAWIKPTGTSAAPQPVVVKRGSSQVRETYGLYVTYPNHPLGSTGRLRFTFGDCSTSYRVESVGSLNWQQWNHVMATYDGARLNLYLNGALDHSAEIAIDPCQNDAPVALGGMAGDTGPTFDGTMDEVRVYPRALSAAEVAALQSQRWRRARLDRAGETLTGWSFDVPEGLEGHYRIHLRGQDNAGHDDTSGSGMNVWQGEVDTLGPRATLTTERVGDEQRYTITAQDFNLTEAGLVLPCGVPLTATRQAFTAPWYASLAGPHERLYELTASCALPAWATMGEAGAYDTPGLAQGVEISGTHAYVSDGENGILVLDLSNPSQPRPVATYDTPGSALHATYAEPAVAPAARMVADPAGKAMAATAVAATTVAATVAEPATEPLAVDAPAPAAFPGTGTLRPGATTRSIWGAPTLQPCVAFAPAGAPAPSLAPAAAWDNAVTAITVDPAAAQLNTAFDITVTVVNAGTWTAAPYDLCLYFGYEPTSCPGPLAAWACQPVTVTSGATETVTYTHPGFTLPRRRELYAYFDPLCNDADDNPDNDLYGPVTITTGDLFTVTGTTPAGNGLIMAMAPNSTITASLSRPVSATTVTTRTFTVHGAQTGVYDGAYGYGGAVSFDAAQSFKPGEMVRFSLSDGVRALDGGVLQPYTWQATAAVLAGTGALNIGQTITLTGTSPIPQAVALGDLDGDGDLDALIGDASGPDHVWRNDGGVLFDTGQSIGGSGTTAVALGDLDGDGDLDAFIGHLGYTATAANEIWLNSGGVLVDRGQALGTFDTCGVALGDLDGDNDLDAVTANGCHWGPAGSRVWLNQGGHQGGRAGVFTVTQEIWDLAYGYSVSLGDLDHDGDLDVVIGDQWQVGVFVNDGEGNIHLAQTVLSIDARDVVLGDLDGDADLDLVAADQGASSPTVIWLNQGGLQGGVTGVFTDSGQTVAISTTYALDLGDLDGDGDLDLFIANDDEADLVYLNDGAGAFADSGQRLGYHPPPATYSGDRSTGVALGDLDGDGDLDALVSSPATADGEPTHVWLNGAGALAPQDDAYTILEDSAATFDVRVNDTTYYPELLTLTGVGAGTQGTTALSGTTAIDYAPALDANGADAFTYTISNTPIQAGTAAVAVTITPVNDAPTFSPSSDPIVEEDAGEQVLVGWAEVGPGPATALDEAGQALTITLASDNPALFAVQPVLDRAGTLTFTTAPHAYGEAWITVTLQDDGGTANGGSDTRIDAFPITVTPVNNAPVAQDALVATAEDTPLTLPIVDVYASDVDGDPLTVVGAGAPGHGVTAADGWTVTYTPTLNFNGTDAFTYTVRDPGWLTDTGSITVAVGIANDPPNAVDDTATTAEEATIAIDVLNNDSDPEGQTLTLAAVGSPAQGTTAVLGEQVQYTPAADFNGTETFTYTITDGALTAMALVAVTVTPVNDPPTLNALDAMTVIEDAGTTSVALSGIGSGAANEAQTLDVTAGSTDPTIIPDPTVTYASPATTGSLAFTPAPDAFGATTIVVTVTDGLSTTTRSFQVTVSPDNDRPTLNPLADWEVDAGAGPQTVGLSGITSGASNEDQTLTVSAQSSAPDVVAAPNVNYVSPASTGALTFEPVGRGYATLTVAVTDGTDVVTRTFKVTVLPSGVDPYLYVADGRAGGLRIYETLAPTALRFTGAITQVWQALPGGGWSVTPVNAQEVAVQGRYAYVAGGAYGLDVIDVTDPSHPAHVTKVAAVNGNIVTVAASGDRLYAGSQYPHRLWIMDITNPAVPTVAGSYTTPYRAKDVAVYGDHVVLADQSGLRIMDVTTPTSPEVVAFVQLGGAEGVALAGGYAYVALNNRGLAVVDVRDAQHPVVGRRFETPGYARDVDIFVAELDGVEHTLAAVADFNEGLRILTPEGIVAETATVCDTAGNCTTVPLTLGLGRQRAGRQDIERLATAAPLSLDVLTPPVLATADTLTITLQTAALSATLRALDVAIDGTTIYAASWPTGSLTETTQTTSWTPRGEGHYALHAVVTDWAGNTETADPTLIVDTQPPVVSMASTVLTTTHYRAPRSLLLKGSFTDTGGVATVHVIAPDGTVMNTEITTKTWDTPWYLGTGSLPDGEAFDLTARARDIVGRPSAVTTTVWADVVPPAEVATTLAPDTGVIRVASPTLTLTWGAATDGGGLPTGGAPAYYVTWHAADALTTTATAQPFASLDPRQATFTAGEAQRITVDLVSRDRYGNTRRQDAGSVIVDGPATPDYIPLGADHWQASGCTLLDVDRRDLWRGEQRLYTTWDSQALRLTWTGANWQTDGDLFVTLDTAPGGATTAFNPYTNTATINLPDGFEADAVIWVRDDAHAEFWQWNGAAWDLTTMLGADHAATSGDRTDLSLPFDRLGIAAPAATPLNLLAFASEEGTLALWATLPAANGLNSANVIETAAFADATAPLTLDHAYHWDVLGSSICPNGSDGTGPVSYGDADLMVNVRPEPAGTALSLLSDDLFWLRDLLQTAPADLTSHLDFLATDYPPLSEGQRVTYTLQVRNRGAVTATGVTAIMTARYALRMLDASPVTLGDVAPGEVQSTLVYGVIDLTRSAERWAMFEAQIYDDAHPATGAPLERVWAYHAVDRAAPVFYGLQSPARYVAPGITRLLGYAYDDGGVPTMTLGIEAPAGGSHTLTCSDDEPQDGAWACAWDMTASNGGVSPTHGDAFTLYAQATDAFGQTGPWTTPYTLIVDSRPPTLTLSGDAAAWSASIMTASIMTPSAMTPSAMTPTLLSDARFTLEGNAGDPAGVAGVDICIEGICEPATRQATTAETITIYDDLPVTPLDLGAGTACSGAGLVRTFTVDEAIMLGAVQVGFAATHAHRDDLRVTLTSPDGTVVTLLDDDGLSGTAATDYDLLLDDSAAASFMAPVDGETGLPRYDRTARPATPLDAFRGEEGAGTWTLRVCDADPAANDGTYIESRLILAPQTTAVTAARWSYTHDEAGALDYVSRNLQIYATDDVGNRTSQPLSRTVIIDNVAPVLTVTEALTEVLAGRGDVALRGIASDGSGVPMIRVTVETPSGRWYDDVAHGDGADWTYVLAEDLALALPGVHRLWLNAVDLAGNVSTTGPLIVNVTMPAITLPPQDIYLPLIYHNYQAQRPDLTTYVSGDIVYGEDVAIPVVNAGNTIPAQSFRVDLFFDPSHTPVEGEPWNALSTYGAHWIVPGSEVAAGQTLLLKLGNTVDVNYPPNFTGMDHAFVRVDTLGAIAESDEDNNLIQIDLPDLDGPDLVVASLQATTNNVQVVVENIGEGVVDEPFWVELYVNPNPTPTGVNQIWNDLAKHGGVWGITEDMLPLRTGDALTLTVGDGAYWPQYSEITWPLPVGTPVYVQADSANARTAYGGVLEYHELVGQPYNNITAGTVVAGGGLTAASRNTAPTGAVDEGLPPRSR